MHAPRNRILAALSVLLACVSSGHARAAAPLTQQRDFYSVLDDTLGDFEYDLKHDTVVGSQNIAVRDLIVSENVPRSFTNHLEDLLAERILRATKSKVLQCLGCRTRRTTFNGKELSLVTPRTNVKENARIARLRGIEHFLDVTFTYQPAGLVLSMTVTDPTNSTILWSRTYNSESSRAAMLRRGLDMDQLDPATRRATEYPSILQYRFRVDYLFEPDLDGMSGCLGFAVQMVERYDNRKKELGFEFEYLQGSASLLNGGTAAKTLYSPVNLSLLIVHAFNLIGTQEDFNQARASINLGLGGTYSSGFLGTIMRVGVEWREAKHFSTGLILGYRPASTSFLPSTTGKQVSGVEFGGGISFLY